MTLSDQVTSFALSKRLKELGVKQKSHFWWNIAHPENATTKANELALKEINPEIVDSNKWADENGQMENIAAFTVAELGQMLQKHNAKFDLITHMMQMDIANTEQKYAVHIPNVNDWAAFISDTEAEARGLLLVYLIEQNLLKI